MNQLALKVLAAFGALLLASAAATQSDYPNKPVRVVVAFTAGGTTDILARAVSQKLTERFKQSFIIDNKPGGGGNIGTELVARAAPDGYTLIEAVIAQLNKAVNEALPSIETQMVREGADPVGGAPAQFGSFVQKEYEKWRVIVRDSGATAE